MLNVTETINEITDRIFQTIGTKLIDPSMQSLGGNQVSKTFLLSDRSNKFFVKILDYSSSRIRSNFDPTNLIDLDPITQIQMDLEEYIRQQESGDKNKTSDFGKSKEARDLEQIYNTQTIKVPKPICSNLRYFWEVDSYTVSAWIEFGNKNNWHQLGKNLAAMHRVTSSLGFGLDRDNHIGLAPQINHWESNWLEFFIKYRLKYQLRVAIRGGLTTLTPEKEFLAEIPKFFQGYNPLPSMVHGDLWSGNVGFDTLGEPIIFDPALYFGDREVDIAMTELFGGFPPEFYQSYNEAFPLDAGYKHRKDVYNLYHILNHFNLFGGNYGITATRMIEEIRMFQP